MSNAEGITVAAPWWRRIGSAVGLGIVWAVAWAPIAVLIGVLIVDPDNSMDEMWPVIGAYPGFLCGVLFYAIIAVAERGRELGEVQLPRASLCGAIAGLAVGALPFAIGEPTKEVPLWLLAGAAIGSITLMSAASAAASVLVRRRLRSVVTKRTI